MVPHARRAEDYLGNKILSSETLVKWGHGIDSVAELSYKRSMQPPRPSPWLQTAAWVVVSAMAASALNGILCNGRPQPDWTMECCRQKASPMAVDSGECCEPDRTENVPSEILASTRAPSGPEPIDQPHGLRMGSRHAPRPGLVPMAASAELHPHLPRGIPLLL